MMENNFQSIAELHAPSTPSRFRDAMRMRWYKFSRNKLSVVGLIVVAAVVLIAIFAPYVAPYPNMPGIGWILATPACPRLLLTCSAPMSWAVNSEPDFLFLPWGAVYGSPGAGHCGTDRNRSRFACRQLQGELAGYGHHAHNRHFFGHTAPDPGNGYQRRFEAEPDQCHACRYRDVVAVVYQASLRHVLFLAQ